MNAERPAILFGQQVWACRGHNEAIALLRGLDIPGYFNGAGRGFLPPGDPHHFDRTRTLAFGKADVVVIVGTPFDFRMGYGKRINVPTLVQIDLGYNIVGKNRDVDLGIAGDPGAVCRAVLQAAGGRLKNDKRQARKEWMKLLTEAEDAALEKLMPTFTSEQTPIHPYRVAYEINEFLTDDTIYIGDGGDVVTISAQAVRPRAPGNWMDPGALGSLGVGTGFAHGGEARASEEGSALLLRRRRLRHDGVRHGDRRSVRRAVHRGDRQQLRHEPDPLRPDREVRPRARQRRQQARRHELLGLPADVGRLGRRGARGRRRSRPRSGRRAKWSPRPASRRW